jgi:predicted nucleic acid-binding protein
MTEVFADAFFYIALLNPSDRHHEAALDATRALRSQPVTTEWVLLEVADALSAPAVRLHVHRFLTQVATDANTLVVVSESSWYSRGLKLYGSRADKSWSLTDCISFEVMRERGISQALTGDQHFVQAGFRALLQ